MKDLTDDDDDDELLEYAAAIAARDNITPEIEPGIQVRRSTLHGFGVFCCVPHLGTGKRLTEYPNVVVTVDPGSAPWTSEHRPCSIELKRGRKYLDAYGYGTDDYQHLGHIFNTSHPSLPPPFNKPSVDFYPMQQNRVYVKTTRRRYYRDEFLADYHWYLTSPTLLCTLPVCKQCPPHLRCAPKKNKW